MIITESFVDLEVPGSGTMRTHVFKPNCDGKFAAVVVYSEIYQVTGPIQRLCRLLASEGYIAVSPEVYHEFEEPGYILKYDAVDTDKGNKYKIEKPVAGYDADAKAVVQWLLKHPNCNGRVGTVGVCLGGHLAFRCAFEPEVIAGVCFFATDIHSGTLGKGGDDTLQRVRNGELADTEMVMIFGKQDNHVPAPGRRTIYDTMAGANADFAWLEVNAQHAFIRDELSKGRYDAAITRGCMGFMLELFQRRLLLGSPSMRDAKPQASAPGPEKC